LNWRLPHKPEGQPAVSAVRIRLAVLALIALMAAAGLNAGAQNAGQHDASQQNARQADQRRGGLAGTFRAYADEGMATRVSAFSGLPVPRYSSLKYDEVNGRAGPSADYPIAWTYHRAGLPVVVVRESEDWRKIRDPQGDEVWVHRRVLAGTRTAITTGQGAMRRKPDSRSAPVARFGPGAIVKLSGCDEGWCAVEAEGRKGYAPSVQLWGASDLPAS
jgi:SH3-like domain-containing protein